MSGYDENGAGLVTLSVTEARGLAEVSNSDLASAIGDAADNADRDGTDYVLIQVSKDEAAAGE